MKDSLSIKKEIEERILDACRKEIVLFINDLSNHCVNSNPEKASELENNILKIGASCYFKGVFIKEIEKAVGRDISTGSISFDEIQMFCDKFSEYLFERQS